MSVPTAQEARNISFLDHLQRQGVLTGESKTRVLQALSTSALPIDVIMTELGIMTDALLESAFSEFCKIPTAEFEPVIGRNERLTDFDLGYAKAAGVLPLSESDAAVTLAMANPLDLESIALNAFYFGKSIRPLACARKRLMDEIDVRLKHSEEETQPMEQVLLATSSDEDIARLKDLALETPVVNLVTRIVQDAFDNGVTDIHVEPLADRVRIRTRLDGVLLEKENVPKSMFAGITTRIKILAALNIAERRLPQDGRMRLSVRGREVDFRVSTTPTVHGETIVLRLLRQGHHSLSLKALGFADGAIDRLSKAMTIPNGLFIVTGPTGSGKTTTLYAMVEALNKPGVKIFTIEDPVEYRIDGVTQLQVDPSVDLDFGRALRAVLRQDPDVILVGEIRDRETAQVAIQAALTGHLVLTTLHTNDSIGAITRLRDMGVDPYLISSTVRTVLAQRLVRKTCRHHPVGAAGNCPHCRGTDYSGRTVVYEILEMSPELKPLIDTQASEQDMKRHAMTKGLIPLDAYAGMLVNTGVTTQAEIARAIAEGGVM